MTTTSQTSTFRRAVINTRTGGAHLTLRYTDGSPAMYLYIGDLAVSGTHACALGRIAGREGIGGLAALMCTLAPADEAFILAERLVNEIRNRTAYAVA